MEPAPSAEPAPSVEPAPSAEPTQDPSPTPVESAAPPTNSLLPQLLSLELTREEKVAAIRTAIHNRLPHFSDSIPAQGVEELLEATDKALDTQTDSEAFLAYLDQYETVSQAANTSNKGELYHLIEDLFTKAVPDTYTHETLPSLGLNGITIAEKTTGKRFYTYCSQELGYAYPTGGEGYLQVSAEADELKQNADKLARALDAGYPIDAFGLCALVEAGDYADSHRGYYTQQVIWAILAGDSELEGGADMPEFAMELFSYAMTGKLTDGTVPVRVNASNVSILPQAQIALSYVDDAADPNYRKYTAAVTLRPEKLATQVTIAEIPGGAALYAGETELQVGDTVSSNAALTMVAQGQPTGALRISYVSYETVSESADSFHTFVSYEINYSSKYPDSAQLYQRMIGYEMVPVAGSDSVSAFTLSGAPEVTPSPTPAPSNPPSGDPDPAPRPTPAPTPSVTPEVEIPEAETPLAPAPEANEVFEEIPEEEVPLAPAPQPDPEEITLEDAEVPLGDLPQTGAVAAADKQGLSILLLAAAAACAAGLAVCTAVRKREED